MTRWKMMAGSIPIILLLIYGAGVIFLEKFDRKITHYSAFFSHHDTLFSYSKTFQNGEVGGFRVGGKYGDIATCDNCSRILRKYKNNGYTYISTDVIDNSKYLLQLYGRNLLFRYTYMIFIQNKKIKKIQLVSRISFL